MKKSSRKRVRRLTSIIVLIGIFSLAALFGSYLTAKVAPGLKFKVLGPSTLTPGQSATITWDTSPENARRWPYEKIEFCTGTLTKQSCRLLAASVDNNGKAHINVPTSLPPSKGVLKFTPRDAQKKLSTSISSRSRAVTVKGAATITKADSVQSSESSRGTSGGSGGGGGPVKSPDGDHGASGGGGGGSTPPPAPSGRPTAKPTSTPTASGPLVVAQCRDGADNDGDGPIDYPYDLGCSSRADTTEGGQCQDGIDNDGDGLIDLSDPSCAVNPESDENISSVAFVTRMAHVSFFQANFSAGDLECQREAVAAQLLYPHTYKAILSSSDVNAKDRLNLVGPITLPNGTIVADNAADLWDGNLKAPIDRYADGQSVLIAPGGQPYQGTARVWSGTNAFGLKYSPSGDDPARKPWCNDWTPTPTFIFGVEIGLPGATDGSWISAYGTSETYKHIDPWRCDHINQLYCIGPS